MPEKFRDKYRIPSSRLKNWDYGQNAVYFVTVNTRKHVHFFGSIKDGNMKMNILGNEVKSQWLKTKDIRADMNLELGPYVVMPNHFHAIIIIGENEFNLHEKTNQFGPQSKNLGSIMRGFKSSVTVFAKQSGFADFEWQPRYHDHIIRNDTEFQNIHNYIVRNPASWEQDSYYSG